MVEEEISICGIIEISKETTQNDDYKGKAPQDKNSRKMENVEANFAYQDNDTFDPSSITNLDVTDFFEFLEEKIGIIDGIPSDSFDFEDI